VTTPEALVRALIEVVGSEHVLTDRDVTASYATDWTRRFQGEAMLVVRPADAEEVAAVVARCAEARVPLVPQGGNTGLVGGSVPRATPMVVLSTRRLDRLEPVDAAAMQVSAGAGVTIARWRQHARDAGLDAPVDFASRESATVGGAVATNAGGSRVVRFGTMRAQVAGVTAVLADGSVIGSLSGLPKETAGLHWPSLLCGSEGTLGVLTAVRLRLVPWYRHTATAMVATRGLDEAVAVLTHLRAGVPHLDAVELILPEAMQLVADHLAARPPVGDVGDTVAYVVVECADHADPTDELTGALAGRDEILDAAVTTEGPSRDRLVAFRDRIAEAIAASGVPLKLDVAVPVGALAELVADTRRAIDRHGGRLIPFGHLAEGNVHLNVLDPGDPEAITADVLASAAGLGGTISAEHGLGIAKTRWLHLIRSPAELAAAAAVKRALDPAGILNPGVLQP
jgi:FAD/FMN-containing dehydrogenase